jgi:hypothetical protein
VRPVAWLKRVGLSQVSKDCLITFFSKAARIWSQGLRAELGEVANAIVQILACAACGTPGWSICEILAAAPSWRKKWSSVSLWITDYLIAAGLPLKISPRGGE